MNWRLKHHTAIVLLLAGIVLVQFFHVLVLVGIIPFDDVGGGRIKSKQYMYLLESFALCANFLLIFILLIKGKFIPEYLSIRHVNWLLEIFGFFFMLNTVGNLFSTSSNEKVIFAPLALMFAILVYFILRRTKYYRLESLLKKRA